MRELFNRIGYKLFFLVVKKMISFSSERYVPDKWLNFSVIQKSDFSLKKKYSLFHEFGILG